MPDNPTASKLPAALEKLLKKWEHDYPANVARTYYTELRAAWPQIIAQVRLEEAIICEGLVNLEYLKPYSERAMDMPCTERRVELQEQLNALEAAAKEGGQ